jgi:hypothetical protein
MKPLEKIAHSRNVKCQKNGAVHTAEKSIDHANFESVTWRPEMQVANMVLKKEHCPHQTPKKASSVILVTKIAPKISPTTFNLYTVFY